MTLKEKKRKLSEILGINLFEPKYKEIDSVIEDSTDKAEEAAQDEQKPAEQAEAPETVEEAAESQETADDTEDNDEDDKTEAEEAEGNAEEEEADNVSEDTKSEDDSEAGGDTDTEDSDNASEGDGDNASEDSVKETDSTEDNSVTEAELFDAKLEAKLLRAGVRENRLESAMKLFKSDHTLADIDKVEKWVKGYPEWTKQKTQESPKPFGMGVGENDTGETAEDKRLRELGIR